MIRNTSLAVIAYFTRPWIASSIDQMTKNPLLALPLRGLHEFPNFPGEAHRTLDITLLFPVGEVIQNGKRSVNLNVEAL